MTIPVFLFIIFIQLLLAALALYRRERNYVLFAGGSVVISLLFILLLEIKLHHIIRFQYGISNTIFYLGCLLLLALFFYYFKNILLQNNYWLLITTAVLWIASGVTDLLADADILSINSPVENIFLISGGISYLLFNCSVLYKFFFSHKITVNGYE